MGLGYKYVNMGGDTNVFINILNQIGKFEERQQSVKFEWKTENVVGIYYDTLFTEY